MDHDLFYSVVSKYGNDDEKDSTFSIDSMEEAVVEFNRIKDDGKGLEYVVLRLVETDYQGFENIVELDFYRP